MTADKSVNSTAIKNQTSNNANQTMNNTNGPSNQVMEEEMTPNDVQGQLLGLVSWYRPTN